MPAWACSDMISPDMSFFETKTRRTMNRIVVLMNTSFAHEEKERVGHLGVRLHEIEAEDRRS